jgi:hypothetical protein
MLIPLGGRHYRGAASHQGISLTQLPVAASGQQDDILFAEESATVLGLAFQPHSMPVARGRLALLGVLFKKHGKCLAPAAAALLLPSLPPYSRGPRLPAHPPFAAPSDTCIVLPLQSSMY